MPGNPHSVTDPGSCDYVRSVETFPDLSSQDLQLSIALPRAGQLASARMSGQEAPAQFMVEVSRADKTEGASTRNSSIFQRTKGRLSAQPVPPSRRVPWRVWKTWRQRLKRSGPGHGVSSQGHGVPCGSDQVNARQNYW